MNAGAGMAVAQIAGPVIEGLFNMWQAREHNDLLKELEYNYGNYVYDLGLAFGPGLTSTARSYFDQDQPMYPGFNPRSAHRWVAQMTPEQRNLIDSILGTRDQPRGVNLASEDLLLDTLRGAYLPVVGPEGNPYAQDFLDVLDRESQRGLERNAPAFMRNLQQMAGGALFGAGSAMQPAADFYQDWVQQAADVQTAALTNLWLGGRANQMQALNWALQMPTDPETMRLTRLLPVAEIPRAIEDVAYQRHNAAWHDWARRQQMVGAQAAGILSQGAGPPAYPPVAPPIPGTGIGAAISDALGGMFGGGGINANSSALAADYSRAINADYSGLGNYFSNQPMNWGASSYPSSPPSMFTSYTGPEGIAGATGFQPLGVGNYYGGIAERTGFQPYAVMPAGGPTGQTWYGNAWGGVSGAASGAWNWFKGLF